MSDKTATSTTGTDLDGLGFQPTQALASSATAGTAVAGSSRTGWLILGLVVVLAIWPTAAFSDYHLFQLTMVVVYGIAILGLALLTGFNGQISLGHGAFYAIGAYTTAIMMSSWDMPYWATLPVSAL